MKLDDFSVGKQLIQKSLMCLTLLGLNAITLVKPVFADKVTYNYYQDDYLSQARENGKKLILVAAGWSESSLKRMDKASNRQKQKRAFAPAYLLASKVYREGGAIKVFYLTSIPISQSYRRYLYRLSTGDHSLAGFKQFEGEAFEIVRFRQNENPSPQESFDPLAGLSYLHSGPNKAIYDALLAKIAKLKGDKNNELIGYSVHATGHYMQKWAKALGIPLLANQPNAALWELKSASRKCFHALDLPHPRGTYEVVRDEYSLANNIYDFLQKTQVGKIVVKLDRSAAGDGNKILDFSTEMKQAGFLAEQAKQNALDVIMEKISSFSANYRRRLHTFGGIIEELVEGKDFSSPATMAMIYQPDKVNVYYAYNQVLAGKNGQSFHGASGFMAKGQAQELRLIDMSQKICRYLSRRGVSGPMGTDFVICRQGDEANASEKVYAIENNVRHTGTMYPYQCSLLLLGENVMPTKFFQSYESFTVPMIKEAKQRKDFEKSFYKWLAQQPFTYSQTKMRGVLVHCDTTALGEIGITAIGDNPQQTQDQLALFKREFVKWQSSWSKHS